MNWTLEVVVVPVSDVERAKAFYGGGPGFVVDHDTRLGETRRIVQLTPPGSGCSIVIGAGLNSMPPGSLQGLQLVVKDMRAARAGVLERGVPVGDIQLLGSTAQRPAQPDDDLNNAGFLFFKDPDGNGWAGQQISARA